MIEAFLKKQGKSQVSNLTLNQKEPEREEKTKAKVSRKKEIVKIKGEMK